MNYAHTTCKTALHMLKSNHEPYQIDLNIYRGCSHGCRYCFAMYSHKYLDNKDFFNDIFIKDNIVDVLSKELASLKDRGVINIGGITDSYQAIEAKQKIMPSILKLMIKYKRPIIISTKSDLILRDIKLIDELSKLTYVNIAATITCVDNEIQKIIEPNAVSSERRFQMLKQIKQETNATVGLHLMPIIPYITATKQNLEAIYKRASEIGVDYVLPGTLYLRGKTKTVFFETIHHSFPQYEEKLKELYQNKEKRNQYKTNMYKYIHEIQKKYNINHNYKKFMPSSKKDHEQLSLF